MNILHIIKQMHIGGAETIVKLLQRGLTGFNHSLLTCSVMRKDQLKHCFESIILFNSSNMLELQNHFSQKFPDFVFYHWYPDRYPFAGELFNSYNAKVQNPNMKWVTIIHDAAEPIPLLASCDRYVAVSKYIASYHDHLPPDQLTIIPNGVPRSPSYEKKRKEGKVRIVKTARADEDRFDESLFELLRDLNNYNWEMRLVVAEGPMLPRILEWRQKYDLNHRVSLAINVDDVSVELQSADIYLDHNPDTCREAWGMSVSEAMAAGLPVVARRRYGVCGQIVDGKTGFLCETPEEMKQSLVNLIADHQLRTYMGNEAKIRANNELSIDKMLDDYQKLLKQLAQGGERV